jgi:hypothetical protein
MILIALAVLGGFGFYVMSPEERIRVGRHAALWLRHTAVWGRLAFGLIVRFVRAVRARDRRALGAIAAVLVLVSIAGVRRISQRSFVDLEPEVARLIGVEQTTAGAYDAAVVQFRLGAITDTALADVIERRVMPELHALRRRLPATDSVRPEQRPLLAKAGEYLDLRSESWRLRADALAKRSMPALRHADQVERVALEAFSLVKTAQRALAP